MELSAFSLVPFPFSLFPLRVRALSQPCHQNGPYEIFRNVNRHILVRRLERDGVILGYTVVTDTPAGPGGLEVFIDVRLDPAAEGESFVQSLRPLPQVLDAVHVTGPFDYLLRVVVADSSALDGLLRHLKRSCGVTQSQTRLALRHPRRD